MTSITHLHNAYNANLIGDGIRIRVRNEGVLLNTCEYICLVVNTGQTKYMEVGHHRGMTANEHITVGSNLHEKVKNF